MDQSHSLSYLLTTLILIGSDMTFKIYNEVRRKQNKPVEASIFYVTSILTALAWVNFFRLLYNPSEDKRYTLFKVLAIVSVYATQVSQNYQILQDKEEDPVQFFIQGLTWLLFSMVITRNIWYTLLAGLLGGLTQSVVYPLVTRYDVVNNPYYMLVFMFFVIIWNGIV